MTVRIFESWPGRTGRGKLGCNYNMRIITGTGCPTDITKFWTSRFCSYLSSKMGFSKPWGKMPYRKQPQLVGLRFLGLFEPKLCQGKPDFEKVSFAPSLLTFNRKLIRAREEAPNGGCPYAFKHGCLACPLGNDQCGFKLAVHPRTYEKSDCAACRSEAWFDPAYPSRCVSCRVANALER